MVKLDNRFEEFMQWSDIVRAQSLLKNNINFITFQGTNLLRSMFGSKGGQSEKHKDKKLPLSKEEAMFTSPRE